MNIKGPTGQTGPQGERGLTGEPGADGVTFTPAVSSEGVISWTNNGGKTNPQPVNIKGPIGQTGPQGERGFKGETGPAGPTGPTGPAGPQGAPGVGVPTGGTAGQILTKASGEDYDTEWTTPDDAPTAGSSNPVSSGGAYTALAGKQDTLTFDSSPTAGSDNPVKSGGIKAALDKKIASLGENLITSVSDDTVAFWLSKGSGYAYFNVADSLHGQPYRFGFLVSYVYGTNVYQEFYSTNDFTGPYYRFANTSQTAMPSFETKTKEGSITFASGIATASDTRYPTKVFRNGNVICLQAAVQTTDNSNFSSTYRELFTLPVGYRPAYRIMAAGCVGNSIWNQTFAAKINIESGGAVSVYIASTSATNANMCQFCVSFIV